LRRVATPTTRPKTGTAITATTAKRIKDAMAMLKRKSLLSAAACPQLGPLYNHHHMVK
jgi:hypothetical protein